MTKPTSTSPRGLGEQGLKLWAEITGSYKLRPDELRMLEDACREADLIDRLEAELVGAPLTVQGSQGQPVANPLIQEVRQHRQVLKGHLTSLKLPDEPGDDASAGSNAGRNLANARWRRGA